MASIDIMYNSRSKDKDGKEVVERKPISDVVDINKDVWLAGKVKVLSLGGFRKIANEEEIVEKKIETVCTPTNSNKQSHIVNIWLGYKGDDNPDNWARGSGEASRFNTGKLTQAPSSGNAKYEELGIIDAMYRYAMAEKRAFCRAMQKLIQLEGVYANVEASDFAKPSDPNDLDY